MREGKGVAFIGDGAGGRLELLIQDAAPVAAPNHLALVVPIDEFDAILAKVRAAGVPADEPIANEFGRLCFFADPSGNRVADRRAHRAVAHVTEARQGKTTNREGAEDAKESLKRQGYSLTAFVTRYVLAVRSP